MGPLYTVKLTINIGPRNTTASIQASQHRTYKDVTEVTFHEVDNESWLELKRQDGYDRIRLSNISGYSVTNQ